MVVMVFEFKYSGCLGVRMKSGLPRVGPVRPAIPRPKIFYNQGLRGSRGGS